MMAALDDMLRRMGFDEEWHEKLAAILLLRNGALARTELKKAIRSKQEKKASESHSYGNCDRCIRELKSRGILAGC
jgi:hypothetical protein